MARQQASRPLHVYHRCQQQDFIFVKHVSPCRWSPPNFPQIGDASVTHEVGSPEDEGPNSQSPISHTVKTKAYTAMWLLKMNPVSANLLQATSACHGHQMDEVTIILSGLLPVFHLKEFPFGEPVTRCHQTVVGGKKDGFLAVLWTSRPSTYTPSGTSRPSTLWRKASGRQYNGWKYVTKKASSWPLLPSLHLLQVLLTSLFFLCFFFLPEPHWFPPKSVQHTYHHHHHHTHPNFTPPPRPSRTTHPPPSPPPPSTSRTFSYSWAGEPSELCIQHGPLTRYVKLWVAHAPGMSGTFSHPPTSKETASWRSRYAS